MNIKHRGQLFLDYLLIFLGASLYALATATFIRPINAPLGGVSGIAQMISYVTALPMGTLIIVLNIPLFIFSFKEMGKRFIFQSLIAMLWSAILIDIMGDRMPSLTDNPLLGALYGGVLMGAGLGLVFSRGATTGGADIVAKMIHRKVEFLSMGRISLIINAVVIAVGSFVFQSIESALFAIVVQYVSSVVIDGILHGMDHANCALIITPDADAMSVAINHQLGRGVTGLTGQGMYTKSDRTVLLVAVRSHEVGVLKRLVYEQDHSAFIIMLSANEVLGKGFKAAI